MFSKLFPASIVALNIAGTLAAGVQFAGVNIAGFDFGCGTDGNCILANIDGPIGQNSNGNENNGGDGPGQMTHFTTKDKLNIFRLPVAWQYLVHNELGGTLDATNLAQYDILMQACLKTGAHCIIDIHNYARWNGNIIGQSGGPTNDDFSGLWKQLAKKYAAESKVVMGLMNEPHDLPSLNSWAGAVQAAVTAIRGAGASSQMILLPGNGYTGASTFVSGGSAAALAGVTNPDGSTTNLIFDVHQYLDSDFSGTHASCTTNGISNAFQPLANWLKSAKRQALLSEIGGGSHDASCITNVCAALDFLNENSDVFLGYVAWAAGSFQTTYVLSTVPIGNNDVPLMAQCFAAKFGGGAGKGNETTTSPSSPAPASSAAAIGGAGPSSAVANSPPAASSSAAAAPPIGGGGSPSIGGGSPPAATNSAAAAPPVGGGGSSPSTSAAAAPAATTSAAVPPPPNGGGGVPHPASNPTLSIPIPMPLRTGTAGAGAAAPTTGAGYIVPAGGSGSNSAGPNGWRWTGEQAAGKQQGSVGICKNKNKGSGNTSQKMKKRRARARKVRFAYEDGVNG